jgi:serine O-acetyltransferase
MKLSLPQPELIQYVSRQLNMFFPDEKGITSKELNRHFDKALQRVEYCFSKVNTKYFFDGKHSIFNHLHADQYCMFLYFLSNTFFRENDNINISSKVYLLNKALHGLDAFYEVNLPDIFLVIHPLATVLGRGTYGDYFIVYQRCGVGSNHDVYPTMGKHVTMHPGSAVLGKCSIGNNCKIGAESLIIDAALEDNSLYIGNPKQNVIKNVTQHSQFWLK